MAIPYSSHIYLMESHCLPVQLRPFSTSVHRYRSSICLRFFWLPISATNILLWLISSPRDTTRHHHPIAYFVGGEVFFTLFLLERKKSCFIPDLPITPAPIWASWPGFSLWDKRPTSSVHQKRLVTNTPMKGRSQERHLGRPHSLERHSPVPPEMTAQKNRSPVHQRRRTRRYRCN